MTNTIVDLPSARKALRITSLGHLRGNVERSRSYAMKAAHLADDQHAPALHRRLMAVKPTKQSLRRTCAERS